MMKPLIIFLFVLTLFGFFFAIYTENAHAITGWGIALIFILVDLIDECTGVKVKK